MFLVDYIRQAGGLRQALIKARNARFLAGIKGPVALPGVNPQPPTCQPHCDPYNVSYFATGKACFKCACCVDLLVKVLSAQLAKDPTNDQPLAAQFETQEQPCVAHYRTENQITVLRLPALSLAALKGKLGEPK